MTGDSPLSPRRGLLGWLGLRNGDEAAADHPAAASAGRSDWRGGRAHLLAAVGDCLDEHDLPADAFTLAIAHDYITGADAALSRTIEQRLATGGALDCAWLDASCRSLQGRSAEQAAARLLARLEGNLDAFTETTTTARRAANDATDAISRTVGAFTAPDDGARLLTELTRLATALLERTRTLEHDIARSEVKTRALRHSLDDARRVAEEDPLTGLPNRRAFETRYAEAWAEAHAAGTPLCVAICDIDDFKRINDAHGHDTGDRVLRSVALGLARISQDDCHVARHGGEEFVVILRGKTLHEAWELLDEARAAQAERRLVDRDDGRPIGKVTFSGGIANAFAHGDPRGALRAADEALYRAKREGRNRIRTAETGPPHTAIAA